MIPEPRNIAVFYSFSARRASWAFADQVTDATVLSLSSVSFFQLVLSGLFLFGSPPTARRYKILMVDRTKTGSRELGRLRRLKLSLSGLIAACAFSHIQAVRDANPESDALKA